MSGGHFDYREYALIDIAEEIEKLIATNATSGRNYTANILDEMRKARRTAQEAYIRIHELDYLLSGDNGEESYSKSLRDKLNMLEEVDGPEVLPLFMVRNLTELMARAYLDSEQKDADLYGKVQAGMLGVLNVLLPYLKEGA